MKTMMIFVQACIVKYCETAVRGNSLRRQYICNRAQRRCLVVATALSRSMLLTAAIQLPRGVKSNFCTVCFIAEHTWLLLVTGVHRGWGGQRRLPLSQPFLYSILSFE